MSEDGGDKFNHKRLAEPVGCLFIEKATGEQASDLSAWIVQIIRIYIFSYYQFTYIEFENADRLAKPEWKVIQCSSCSQYHVLDCRRSLGTAQGGANS